MGDVIHLHRIRAALRLLLATRTDPRRAHDRRYLQQIDTAIDTLRAHAAKLPTRHRCLIDVLLDHQATPALRSHALDHLDHQLRLSPTTDPEHPPTAAVLRHPTHPASTRLFDPDGGDPPRSPVAPAAAPQSPPRTETRRSAP